MPRFPFARSPSEDLRDLYRIDRLRAQARGLGHSSISPGEGSLDVRNAAGNPVARYGHEGGKSGLLVPDGSGWQTIQEYTAAQVAAGTSALGTRMGAAEGRLDSHASRIGAAESDISAVEGVNAAQTTRLDGHASRIGAAEGVNTTQNGRLDAHASRLGAAENGISAAESAINVLATTIVDRETAIRDWVTDSFVAKIGP